MVSFNLESIKEGRKLVKLTHHSTKSSSLCIARGEGSVNNHFAASSVSSLLDGIVSGIPTDVAPLSLDS